MTNAAELSQETEEMQADEEYADEVQADEEQIEAIADDEKY